MIQNAFDAVKERIAHEIINKNLDPEEYQEILGKMYSIELRLEEREDGIWFICKDDGVGMTKGIIERYFLESGASKRHEILELERQCEAKGFHLSRTGQFGIGVLSYFMVAEKVIVKTKRLQHTGYEEGNLATWQFEINGRYDFGELKKADQNIVGTEISLKIRKGQFSDITEWSHSVFPPFLKSMIKKTPCMVNYSSIGSKPFNIQKLSNWTTSEDEIRTEIGDQFRLAQEYKWTPAYLTSKLQARQIAQEEHISQKAFSQMMASIKFLKTEGKIGKIGKFRIFVPYFDLKMGPCLYYLFEDLDTTSCTAHRVFEADFWIPHYQDLKTSLKGIEINSQLDFFDQVSRLGKFDNCHIEMDIETMNDPMELSVSRHKLNLQEIYSETLDEILNEIVQLLGNHQSMFNNCYATLNSFKMNFESIEPYWAFNFTKSQYEWTKIDFHFFKASNISKPHSGDVFRNDQIQQMNVLRGLGLNDLDYFNEFGDNLILGMNPSNDSEKGLWFDHSAIIGLKPESRIESKNGEGIIVLNCPPEWKNILMNSWSIDHDMISFINQNHELFRFFTSEPVSLGPAIDYAEMFDKSINKLSTKSEAVNFLVHLIRNVTLNLHWLVLCERNDKSMVKLFEKSEVTEILVTNGVVVSKITPEGVNNMSELDVSRYAPSIVSDDYTIFAVDDGDISNKEGE